MLLLKLGTTLIALDACTLYILSEENLTTLLQLLGGVISVC